MMLAAGAAAGPASGQGPAGTASTKGDGPGPLDRWKREAAEYRFAVPGRDGPGPALRDEPVLRWTNPIRDTDDGIALLWVDRGRPAAVACFYRVRWQGRATEGHEFHSLAPAGFTVTRDGGTVWAPRGAGFAPRPIPRAPRPAESAAERLRQIQALAREFRASVDDDRKAAELRMLSRPIYRYEAGPGPEGDGALFAFVLTTDPEAILAIEALPGPDGPAWHAGFARMTDHSLRARHRDAVVWEVAPIPGDKGIDNPYCVRWDVGPQP